MSTRHQRKPRSYCTTGERQSSPQRRASSSAGVTNLQCEKRFGSRQNLRPSRTRAPEGTVVAIDEQSAQKLGLPSKPSEWPRDLHAQLVERLAQAGARVICFDLTFDTPSRTPQHDVEFAAAIDRAANVVLTDSLRK